LPVNLLPHIPGEEFVRIVEKVGSQVRTKKGDRVAICPRVLIILVICVLEVMKCYAQMVS
jgi:NADPH:quinone reductase-like Zn-dependent oxidoreductase